jgi:PKD repeat protein
MKTKVSIAMIMIILAVLGGAVILSALYSGGTNEWMFRVVPAGTVPSPVQTTIGTITINAPLPQGPATLPLYHGYYGPNDKIDYSSPNSGKIQNSIPEVSEVPELAEQALAPYGGIPTDAVSTGIFKSTSKAMNLTTGEVVAVYLDFTTIGFSRQLNGMPVFGSGAQTIHLEFGENGELLWLHKKWLTLNQIDQVPIITSSQAADKLLRGEILNRYQEPVDVTITNISLGYYEGYPDRAEETLEPVWIFSGPTSHGNGLSFFVDARVYGSSLQFGNFTASPRSGTAPLTVSFRDTSIGPVWKWRWDFGDGTIDWTQNPVHTYQNKGMYTVKLLVSDDERDNMIVKTNYVLIGKKAIVMHIDTKLDELISALNAMDIQHGIKNSLTQKLENAQKKNDDALKFIDQNKETQANNMLNAEDNLMNAFVNEVDAQTGKAISTADATKLNSGATEIRGLIQEAIGTPI